MPGGSGWIHRTRNLCCSLVNLAFGERRTICCSSGQSPQVPPSDMPPGRCGPMEPMPDASLVRQRPSEAASTRRQSGVAFNPVTWKPRGANMATRMVAVALTLALGIALANSVSTAQPTDRLHKVGIIINGGSRPFIDRFREDFTRLGYVDGKDVVIEPRFAEGNLERLPALADELVKLEVDVLRQILKVRLRR
jgi:hypothetical protein